MYVHTYIAAAEEKIKTPVAGTGAVKKNIKGSNLKKIFEKGVLPDR